MTAPGARTPFVAGWALASAAGAPVLLIGGWTVAARRQPPGYDPTTDTISALAGHAASDRWVMTLALAGVGLCHLVTALGLRRAAATGRAALALGGVATVLVAAFPLSSHSGDTTHAVAAGVAFLALAGWPALARPRSPGWWTATLVLLVLLAWFGRQLAGGDQVGLAERVAAGAQALWPLVAVLLARREQAGAGQRRPPTPTSAA